MPRPVSLKSLMPMRVSALAAALLSLPAAAQPEIRWVVTDWPPLFLITKNQPPTQPADLGDGQFDRLLAELTKRLPAYKHRIDLLNSNRLWHGIAAGQPYCAAASLKTPERLALAYFTPVLRVAPMSLVVRAQRAEEFVGSDGRASLAQVSANRQWQGRLETARSYGAALDALVADAATVPREATVRVGQFAEWVSAGRLDYTLEYANVIEYLRRNRRLNEDLATLPIREASEAPVAHVVCPRTPWGLAAITAIDAAIRQASASRSFREAYARWLPASARAAHQALADAFYEARAQGGPQIE